ncbi:MULTISPECIES: AAA family ATPase [Limimaricola]|uniref:AAA family ATPase n=1 Tax=Limimaricola litoreus TaxID=2955316 RepID=A0A9X2FP63_9RHOB|nr:MULTISPECIES: AAA family ATPase [Limimaricola]MCP1167139.1 AAA family ATPase [Limimaricola litoreus]
MSDSDVKKGHKASISSDTGRGPIGFDLDELVKRVIAFYAPDVSSTGEQICDDIVRGWWSRQDRFRRAELATFLGFAFDAERDDPKPGAEPDDVDVLADLLESVALQDLLVQRRISEAKARIKREAEARVQAEKKRIYGHVRKQLSAAPGRAAGRKTSASQSTAPQRYLLDKSAIDRLPENGRSVRKSPDLMAACTQKLGLAECTDRSTFARVRETLACKFPHAIAVIDGLLRPLERGFMTGRAELKLRPTILVGGPGSGKTALLRDFAAALELPVTRISVAGSSDSNVFGVSAGWSTSLPSIMTSTVASSRLLNPAIILDELDKAYTSRNGSVQESLLPLLEPTEAVHYHERFLASAVNASHINWLFTANSLDRITAPLLSRCDVYEMPTPSREHVRPIVRAIIAEYARDLGLHTGFVRLSTEDVEFLENSYDRHRSVRVLAELVRQLLDAQEQDLPRA